MYMDQVWEQKIHWNISELAHTSLQRADIFEDILQSSHSVRNYSEGN